MDKQFVNVGEVNKSLFICIIKNTIMLLTFLLFVNLQIAIYLYLF